MRFFFLTLIIGILLLPAYQVLARQNVGREYGNYKLPILVLHLKEKNQRMLQKGKCPKHGFFGIIVCFKMWCKKESRRNKSLHAVSFSKFNKKIEKNARKGAYDKTGSDSVRRKPTMKPVSLQQIRPDTNLITKQQEAQVPVLDADSLIILNEFLFETNSATLKSTQFQKLNSLLDFLISNPLLTVKITGHTDNTGKESHNKALSANRAKVIAEYLIVNGVAENRLRFSGVGSSLPLMPNDTAEGRSKNRRVELLIQNKR